MGLEPMISRTTIWRANQLHHTHHITYRTVFCPTKYHHIKFSGLNEPGGIRTLDLRLRRPLLYPAEPPGPKPGALAKLSHTPMVFLLCHILYQLRDTRHIIYDLILIVNNFFCFFYIFFKSADFLEKSMVSALFIIF